MNMNTIEESIATYISPGKKYLLAVSGGADSMVLLAVAKSICHQKDAELRVITVEHGIRGTESKKDAEFVNDYCRQNGINCKIVHVHVPKSASENKQTIEEAARNLRYKALFKNLQSNEVLLVAHNKNDQAETVLMHIFRGSGIDGAKGMTHNQNMYRPLLNISKQEIFDYANKNKIPYVHDKTNDDINYSRNYVRKEIIPKIEKIYPNVVNNITKFADFCADCSNLINELADSNYIQKNSDIVEIDGKAFSQNKLVIAKIVKNAYNMLGEFSDLESKHILKIQELFSSSINGSTINIPHGITVEKRENKVILYKISSNNNKNCKFLIGENLLPNNQIVIAQKINKEKIDFISGNFYADYHKIPFDAVWRTRQPGDKFEKLGALGGKKLNDYFTDKKFNYQKRSSQIVLAKGSTILYVEGEDISNNIKIDAKTEVVIELTKSKKVQK